METKTFSVKASSKDMCYSHVLPSHDGKCKNLHGHNGIISVEVFTDTLMDDDLFVTDYKHLKAWIKELDNIIDHKFLTTEKSIINISNNIIEMEFNDIKISIPKSKVSIFKGINETSSECLLVWIKDNKLNDLINTINSTSNTKIHKVILEFEETKGCIAKLEINYV